MKRFLAAFALIAPLGITACTVNLSDSEAVQVKQNQCSSDSDCRDGACWFNVCTAHEGAFSTLLLELTPPATTPVMGIGGLRSLRMESGLSRSNEQHDLDLQGISTVHGYIKGTCRYDVTLSPEEQSYGLPVVSYVAHTATASAAGLCQSIAITDPTQEFVVDVPAGTTVAPSVYDVYLRPSTASPGTADPAPGCENEIPQLILGRVKAGPGVTCVPFSGNSPQSVDVSIPWLKGDPGLDGWKLDILDSLSGNVLSQTKPIERKNGGDYSASLRYSPAMMGSTKSGQELVRLSPPSADAGPVIQLSLDALVASSPLNASGAAQAVFPSPLGPFPTKVSVNGWVRQEADQETPVPSTVTFTATQLDGMPPGIFASFSTTVMVGQDGQLQAELLPGDYRVRVVPAIDPSSVHHLAARETTLTVGIPQDGMVAGRALFVSEAATIQGRAASPLGGYIDGALVQALPASIGTRSCDAPDASTCESQPLGVLEVSLAEDAFVPRAQGTVTSSDGTFTLDDVDCGGCGPDTPHAFYDLSIQPPDATRLPWILKPGLSVSADLELDMLTASLPIIQRGTVQFPITGKEPTPVPGTLIRAYLVRDATGAPVSNPEGLPSCSSGTYSGDTNPTRCIRSVLQVASTSAGPDGKYELVLPSAIDSLTQ